MNGWQIAVVVLMIWTFFLVLKSDFHGTEAKEAGGFFGAILTILLFGILVWLFYGAGLFSTLVK